MRRLLAPTISLAAALPVGAAEVSFTIRLEAPVRTVTAPSPVEDRALERALGMTPGVVNRFRDYFRNHEVYGRLGPRLEAELGLPQGEMERLYRQEASLAEQQAYLEGLREREE